MYPAALHRIPKKKQWYRHKFLKDEFFISKKKVINKITKSWVKNTIKNLEQVCPKQAQDFLSWLLSPKTILQSLMLSSWSVIRLVRSIS